MICQRIFGNLPYGELAFRTNSYILCFADYVYHLCIVEYYARAPLLTNYYRTWVPGFRTVQNE